MAAKVAGSDTEPKKKVQSPPQHSQTHNRTKLNDGKGISVLRPALLNDGSVESPADPSWIQSFYCNLLSGTLLPDTNGGFQNGPTDVSKYLTGWNRSDAIGNQGLLWGGSGNSNFSVYQNSNLLDCFVQNWQVGTAVQGDIVAWSDKDWSIAWADMHLDSIIAVPEPSIDSLLLISCGTWFLWNRRRASIEIGGK